MHRSFVQHKRHSNPKGNNKIAHKIPQNVMWLVRITPICKLKKKITNIIREILTCTLSTYATRWTTSDNNNLRWWGLLSLSVNNGRSRISHWGSRITLLLFDRYCETRWCYRTKSMLSLIIFCFPFSCGIGIRTNYRSCLKTPLPWSKCKKSRFPDNIYLIFFPIAHLFTLTKRQQRHWLMPVFTSSSNVKHLFPRYCLNNVRVTQHLELLLLTQRWRNKGNNSVQGYYTAAQYTRTWTCPLVEPNPTFFLFSEIVRNEFYSRLNFRNTRQLLSCK